MELTKEQIDKLYEAVRYSKYTPTWNMTIQQYSIKGQRLQLRKFEDITKEEKEHYEKTLYLEDISIPATFNDSTITVTKATLNSYIYLLSIGIDLFDAIEKGYAERITNATK